jgi:hypothetical protein
MNHQIARIVIVLLIVAALIALHQGHVLAGHRNPGG